MSNPYVVCNYTRDKSFGLAASDLDQLKTKGRAALGFKPDTLVSLVLDDDGTIVEDKTYFQCLPSNTKFMLLRERERWFPKTKNDGGTAWLIDESDSVDSALTGTSACCHLTRKLKQDLANIILMSEEELQSLVDMPCSDLAEALGFRADKARALQDTLQNVLDRREEERQSRELLQLYLQAVEKENHSVPTQEGLGETDETDAMTVDCSSQFSPRTLRVLKGKTSPETRLSNAQLQMVVSEETAVMAKILGWNLEKTSAVQQTCERELSRRLTQVQAMQSLSTISMQAGAGGDT